MRSLPRSLARPASALDSLDIARRLSAIPVAEMCDTMQAAGIAPAVLPLPASDLPFAGPAVCLAFGAKPLPIAKVDRSITAGAVVVVGPGHDVQGALVGGNMVTAWRQAGCAAVVVDGRIRDCDAFVGLPLCCRGTTPLNSRLDWRIGAVDRPIDILGVTIHPGDWLQGDRDGTIVIPGRLLARLIRWAESVHAIEQRMRAQIAAGEDRQQVYAADRYGHIIP